MVSFASPSTRVPLVLGFAGYSGSGKTTFIEQLIPLLVAQGYQVAVIKHAHHRFDIDTPGKDSYRHRAAGASQVVVRSDKRWVLMQECSAQESPDLAASIARLQPCDIVLVEGCKAEKIPKVEVWRSSTQQPRLQPNDPNIIAVLSDELIPNSACPVLDINQPQAFILWMQKQEMLSPL